MTVMSSDDPAVGRRRMLGGVSSKARRGQLGRRHCRALEFGVCLDRALTMWTHEEMRDDRGRLVRQQLGTEPLHLDMAVRAYRCFEMLGSASETINHGARVRFRKP